MIYGSVCSGIESASLAWGPLGWRAAFLAETAKFPRAVLKHRFPGVPLRGDFTNIEEGDHEPIDVLVGGTPCQSFSVAGARRGLDDPRGDLSLEFLALARRLRPRWLVFENVPGLLSNWSGAPERPPDLGRCWEGDETSDFATFLGALQDCGYGFAWRVLDARYFALAQRRPRLFVVDRLGDWEAAAQVLVEPESLRGDPAPGGEARQDVAGPVTASLGKHGGASAGKDCTIRNVILHDVAGTLSARTKGGGALGTDFECNGGLIAFNGRMDPVPGETVGALDQDGNTACIALVQCNGSNVGTETPSLRRGGGGKPGQSYPAIADDMGVRRLTTLECERLQGLPDHWTAIPWKRRAIPDDEADYLAGHGLPVERALGGAAWTTTVAPDTPRYMAIGNAMPTTVMAWIGARIAAMECTS